ncbi:hypothetical protein HHI36_021720 [Cryptolaemus montrouzieri]
MDVDMETVSLLDHDSVAENFDRGPATLELIESAPQQSAPKFTTKATLQVNVDDPLQFNDLDQVDKKPYETEQISAKVMQSKYSVYIQNYLASNEVKKIDENGNAVHQNTASKGKKKKVQADKNVVSCVAAEKVEGHRSDIINDVKKLLEFIGENKPQSGAPNKTNANRSSKQLHKHTSEEGPRSGKKQRAQSTKGKESRTELKKSNSLGEISTTKMENFGFDDDDRDVNEQEGGEVILRAKKDVTPELPRERRSWGDVEHPTMQNFYKNPSTENIETASSSDFRVVTKKKKTKKRRNSVSGSRRKTSNVTSNCANSSKSDGDRASSPVPRRKSACSVPHSERSNDSSDVDSVHSLPIDTSQRMDSSLNSEDAPISYADIAKNSERKQQEVHKKFSPESKTANSKENSPHAVIGSDSTSPDAVRSKSVPHSLPAHVSEAVSPEVPKAMAHAQSQTTPQKAPPPDVHNIRSFPTINSANNKLERSGKPESKTNTSRGGNNKLQQHQGRQQAMVQCNNAANANRNVRNQPPQMNVGPHSEIQNDLSIIQANEIDTIQYNSQIMPTIQIPDVQTIEKIHFMSQPGGHMPPHLQQHVVPPQHVHMAPPPHHHHHHPLPMVPMTEMFPSNRPPAYTAIITHTPHQPTHGSVAYVKASQAYEGVGVTYMDPTYLPPKTSVKEGSNAAAVVPNVIENQNNRTGNFVTPNTQTSNVVESKHKSLGNNKSIDEDNANSTSSKNNRSKYSKKFQSANEAKSGDQCVDRLKDMSKSASPSNVQYGCTASHSSPTPTVIVNSDASTSFERPHRQGSAPKRGEGAESSSQDDLSASNCDNRTNASECASSDDSSSDSRPPVVILSGQSNKEVSGLEFGFDVNEQLLSEDICENFVQRFVVPETYSATSHNHDKIVNYIGSAWEEIRKSHSAGKAQYYSEDNL